MGLPLIDQSDDEELDIEKSDLDVFYYLNTTYRKDSERRPKRFYGSRMWRAMELAISICKPGILFAVIIKSQKFLVRNIQGDPTLKIYILNTREILKRDLK